MRRGSPSWLAMGAIAVMIVGSAALLVAGDDEGRRFGLGGLLFFGVGSIPLLIARVVRTPRPPRIDAIALPDGSSGRGLVLPMVSSSWPLQLVGAAGVIGGAVVLALGAGPTPTGIVLALCGFVFAVAVVVQLVSRSSERFLGLLPDGALVSGGGTTFIPWAAVADVRLRSLYGQQMLVLDLSEPAAVRRGGGAGLVRLVATPFLGFSSEQVALSVIDADPDAVLGIVARLAGQAHAGDPDTAWLLDDPLGAPAR